MRVCRGVLLPGAPNFVLLFVNNPTTSSYIIDSGGVRIQRFIPIEFGDKIESESELF